MRYVLLLPDSKQHHQRLRSCKSNASCPEADSNRVNLFRMVTMPKYKYSLESNNVSYHYFTIRCLSKYCQKKKTWLANLHRLSNNTRAPTYLKILHKWFTFYRPILWPGIIFSGVFLNTDNATAKPFLFHSFLLPFYFIQPYLNQMTAWLRGHHEKIIAQTFKKCRLAWDAEVLHRCHKRPSLLPYLKQMNRVYSLTPISFTERKE